MKKKWIFPLILGGLVGLGALMYCFALPNLPSMERQGFLKVSEGDEKS